MNEDELRTAFARHEAEAPDVEELHMTINKEASRRRRRRGTMLAGGVAAGVALAVGLPMYLAGQAAPATKTPTAAASSSMAASTKDLNLLLLGSDRRGSWEKGDARSDTIMIVHIPADRKKIYLISVERDVQVEIPGHGNGKINSAFSYGVQKTGTAEGGLDLTEKTLTQLSGVTFDGGAVVEYTALRSITDTLGGVRVCLPQRVPLYLDPAPNAKPRKVLPAGCQVLNGTDAQGLVQQRMGLPNGAYDRDRDAQRYMLGVAEKVAKLNLSDAATVLRLTRTSGLTVQLDGITAPELALQLHDIQPDHIIALSLSNTFHGDGAGETIPPQGLALLRALKERNLDEFILEHPEMMLER